MSFGGLNFVFDGQYSEFYGLQIMTFDGAGLTVENTTNLMALDDSTVNVAVNI